ncbi:hypothetical protein [Cohnella nanjingensis]|uniref:Uncharacterized protein n=1 Tax=Cohnella nanjingensis TaxID=1387779 RepID=A0A7X0RS95_9BACL|nr:hypothetical protein [Cohnella nanjingensis]MBB6672620.1 hypothetical protein [Cohnella nanjingensis]
MTTRVMTQKEAAWIAHAVGGDPLIASYIDNQVDHGQDFYRIAANLPVCGRCERLVLVHNKGYVCPTCGHTEENSRGHKMKTHLRRGMYR